MKVSTLIFSLMFATLSFSQEHSEPSKHTVSNSKLNSAYISQCGKSPKTSGLLAHTQGTDPKSLEVYELFRVQCATCHNPFSSSGAKTFNDILNVSELTSKGIVTPSTPENSPLLRQVESGDMPQGGTPLTAEQKKMIREWIADGAKPFSSESVEIPEVGTITNDDLEACMAQDLNKLSAEDQSFARYVNLANLYNAQRRGELKQGQLALNKLLNSLSWNPKITNTIPIDGTNTLFRIDLRKYDWTPEIWEAIAAENPYKKSPGTATRNTSLVEMTKTETPNLRGDWLAFAASRPPLYNRILYELPELPLKIKEARAQQLLEQFLAVDVEKIERNGNYIKAGFYQSNVTKSNRTISRYQTRFGSYWKSDDFKTREGEQNIFEHPLDYKRDGGEYIFTLPNKLHGYLITDKNGNRLDAAPKDVVEDPARAHKDGLVLNGVSCMSCHTRGMKEHEDEILTYFDSFKPEAKKKLDSATLDLIKKVRLAYKSNGTLSHAFKGEQTSYEQALSKTQNIPQQKDTVSSFANEFEAPLDLNNIAAELATDPATIDRIINSSLTLKGRLVYGKQKVIERSTFNKNFALMKSLLESSGGDIEEKIKEFENQQKIRDVKVDEISLDKIDYNISLLEGLLPGSFSFSGTSYGTDSQKEELKKSINSWREFANKLRQEVLAKKAINPADLKSLEVAVKQNKEFAATLLEQVSTQNPAESGAIERYNLNEDANKKEDSRQTQIRALEKRIDTLIEEDWSLYERVTKSYNDAYYWAARGDYVKERYYRDLNHRLAREQAAVKAETSRLRSELSSLQP